MPSSQPLNAIDLVILADHPENVDVRLPSALPRTLRNTHCVNRLPEIEYRLHFAQATNALHEVRLHRRLLRVLTAKTQVHITNTQKTTTRARGTFDKYKDKQAQAVANYRASWKAIKVLAPNEEFGRWKSTLKELKDADICGPGRKEFETSESKFVQLWIWSTAINTSTSAEDSDLDITLRVEWCKDQERAKRYEELELVIEEMRRTLVTFELNACDWEQKAASASNFATCLDPATVSGAIAYAHKQADVQRKLIKVFLSDWYGILEGQPLAASWLSNYPRPPTNTRRRLSNTVQRYHSSTDSGTPTVQGTSSDVADVATSDTPTKADRATKQARLQE